MRTPATSIRRAATALAAALAALAAAAAPAAAEDSVYWTASKDTVGGLASAIGRADLDGGGGADLIVGGGTMDIPTGLAIDVLAGRIYWGSAASIYSANLDGSDERVFDATSAMAAGAKLTVPLGLAFDASTRRLYWSNGDVMAANQSISYANVDGPGGGSVNTTGATLSRPAAIALDIDNQRVYWTNIMSPQGIAFAALPGGSGGAGTLAISGATVNQARGIALDGHRLIWTNGSGDTPDSRLKAAYLNGTTSIDGYTIDITGAAVGGFRTPAIDLTANRVYWANAAAARISYAALFGPGGGADLPTAPARTYAPDGVVLLKAPEPVNPPDIYGTLGTGYTLTCGEAVWAADAPGSALYRMPASTAVAGWTRDGVAIPGATGATYVPDTAGVYRCSRTATNFAGTSTQLGNPALVTAPTPEPPRPPAPPPPAAPPPRSTLVVGTKLVHVSANGVVAVPVSCEGNDPAGCVDEIRLRTLQRLRIRTRAGSETIAARTSIGSLDFKLAMGSRATAAVALNAVGRRLASTRAEMAALLFTTRAGEPPTLVRTVTLRSASAPEIALGSSAAAARGGRVALRLRCAAAAGTRCRGTLTITARLAGASRTIARRAVTLRGGRTARVSVTLTAAARSRLRRAPLTATQAIASTVAVGLPTQRRARLRLTAG